MEDTELKAGEYGERSTSFRGTSENFRGSSECLRATGLTDTRSDLRGRRVCGVEESGLRDRVVPVVSDFWQTKIFFFIKSGRKFSN